MKYRIKRSKRKTIGLEIVGGELLVRAPVRATEGEIERVISDHRKWIEKSIARQMEIKNRAAEKGMLSEDDVRRLAEEARKYIPGRVIFYGEKLGVRPAKITIRNQKRIWGSCSSKGNLNFNCLLMLAPMEVIDSVVVHELCHLIEMNHSARFYEKVLEVYPNYRKHHAWLSKNGPEIMARAAR